MPKSPGFPEPESQPYVGGIVGTNVICMILHMYFAPPEAGEGTRGYLHGGLLLDFVGQKGPSSKLHLVLLDLMILFLQLTTLAATLRRKSLAKAQKGSQSVPPPETSTTTSADQDHDAEERGEHRALLSDALESGHSSQETQPSVSTSDRDWDLLDWYASGQSTIAELLVADTVRQQHNAYQAYRNSAPTTSIGERVRINLGYDLNLPFRS
jgi:hypothetical protein